MYPHVIRRALTLPLLGFACAGLLSGCMVLPLIDGIATETQERGPRSESPTPEPATTPAKTPAEPATSETPDGG